MKAFYRLADDRGDSRQSKSHDRLCLSYIEKKPLDCRHRGPRIVKSSMSIAELINAGERYIIRSILTAWFIGELNDILMKGEF